MKQRTDGTYDYRADCERDLVGTTSVVPVQFHRNKQVLHIRWTTNLFLIENDSVRRASIHSYSHIYTQYTYALSSTHCLAYEQITYACEDCPWLCGCACESEARLNGLDVYDATWERERKRDRSMSVHRSTYTLRILTRRIGLVVEKDAIQRSRGSAETVWDFVCCKFY